MTFAALPLLVTLAASHVTPTELESAATHQVAREFERIGRRTPVRDDALSAAARRLADIALDDDANSAADLVTTTDALSQANAWDPSPRILVIKGAPADEPLKMLDQRHDLSSDSATHVGIGAAVHGDGSAIVVLFSQRRARMQPFTRHFPTAPGVRELCGILESPLQSPEVAVTRPDGTVERATLASSSGAKFCARVPLEKNGRYTLEVLGRGPKGPEVAALFFVDVGAMKVRAASALGPEPKDVRSARNAILERINALRKAHGLLPLQLDDDVSNVAQAYSQRMAREHFFAHVSPGGDTVGQRLRAAHYPFRGAGENLGSASGPLAAHFGIEHSPGHRKNLLEASWSRVGIGIAQEQTESGPQTLVTEVFVDPVPASADPLQDAYRALAEKRAGLKLPALKRNAVLEQLALDHARRALELDDPKAELPGSKLHERVFAALDDVRSASVDLFVADSPGLIEASKSLSNPKFSWVGVGAVKGSSRRFGPGKYWVVVIYAAR